MMIPPKKHKHVIKILARCKAYPGDVFLSCIHAFWENCKFLFRWRNLSCNPWMDVPDCFLLFSSISVQIDILDLSFYKQLCAPIFFTLDLMDSIIKKLKHFLHLATYWDDRGNKWPLLTLNGRSTYQNATPSKSKCNHEKNIYC